RWIINLFRLLSRCITLKTRLHAVSPVFNSKHMKKLKSSSLTMDRQTKAHKSYKIKQNKIGESMFLRKKIKGYQRREVKDWNTHQEHSSKYSMRMGGVIKRWLRSSSQKWTQTAISPSAATKQHKKRVAHNKQVIMKRKHDVNSLESYMNKYCYTQHAIN